MKRALKIIGIVFAVILVIAIALPFIINVNSFRPKLESTLTSALGRGSKSGQSGPVNFVRQRVRRRFVDR